MKLLALDTATEACSAAVFRDGRVLNHRFELAPRRHAELILPQCDAVLAEAGLELKDLDALAFGRGPGAFTGVRVAVSVAQGIGFAADLPLIPVSTLAALAHGVWRRQGLARIAAALDARMGEVYWACYEIDPEQGARLIGAEQLADPARVRLPDSPGWHGAGDGWQRHASLRRLPIAGCWPDSYPDAVDIAWLAGHYGRCIPAVAAEQALPVYLRDQVAQVPSAS